MRVSVAVLFAADTKAMFLIGKIINGELTISVHEFDESPQDAARLTTLKVTQLAS